MNTNAYLAPLIQLLQSNANPANGEPMAAYMRDQFVFLGIKTPERKKLFKQFWTESGPPPLALVDRVAWTLWQRSEREYHYVVLDLLDRMRNQLASETIALFEQLVVQHSWWDTVDRLASPLIGFHFQRFPELRQPWIEQWRSSDNFWLRRVTLIFQLRYKANIDAPLLFALIEENKASKEFFIQKAIGWALREYSKTDGNAVQQFVAQTELAPLSQREALKWLKRNTK